MQGRLASGHEHSHRPDAPAELALPLERERALVERAKTDIDAFTELYRHYLPRVHAFAWRRTGDLHAAEDVCAATFEAALRGIATFRWSKGGLAPWLFRIAANESVGHHRREQRPRSDRGQRAMANLHEPDRDDDLDAALGDDTAELRRALDTLNPRYQRAVALRYLADLDPDDAARAMAVSKPTFAVILSRALKALRKELANPSPTTGGGEHT